MTSAGSGAVFFLGSRAHYQVLQTPDTRSYDVENGNASTETIYQNTADPEVWKDGQNNDQVDNALDCELNEALVNENCNTDIGTAVKRRSNRCSSEITLCEGDNDMKPALLNHLDSETPKSKPRARVSLIAFLTRLAKRAKSPNETQSYALQSALTVCSYREACRCLDCQSRYFECDESEGYSSDDSEYSRYLQDYQAQTQEPQRETEDDDDDDDEVFIDSVPGDNTSTDLLIEAEPPPRFTEKMSISSDDVDDASLQLEVAAGTPALLNYLLNHPITCAIQ